MANTVYSNKVIEAKAKDILSTKINARSMMTIDDSLVGAAGMIKTINTYTYTGTAEEVAAGAGNTSRGSIAYVGKDYTVKMVQQAFDYLDEDFMKDNVIVDMGIQGATSVMSNKMTSDFYAALATKNGGTELVKGITFTKGKEIGYDVIANERYRYDGYGIFTTRLSGGLMIADHVMLGVVYKLQVKDNHACHGIGASLSYRF